MCADLDLEPVTLFKCWRALKKLNTRNTPTIPPEITKQVGEKVLSNPIHTHLNASNLKKIFEKSLPETEAVAVGTTYRTLDGSLTVLFWSPENKRVREDFSHQDVMKAVLQGELRAVNAYLAQPGVEKLPFLLDIQANLTGLKEEMEKNPQKVPEAVAERFFNFELKAIKSQLDGEISIKSIEFQKPSDGPSVQGPFFARAEEFQAVLDHVVKSISPKLRPALYKADASVLYSFSGRLQIQAPLGSKIIELSK